MSPIIYFLASYYPWWGLPCAYIIFELARAFIRRGRKILALGLLGTSGLLVLLAIFFFYANGFQNVVPALQALEKNM